MPAVALFVYGLGAAAAATFGVVAGWAVGLAIGSVIIALTVASSRRAANLGDSADAGFGSGQQVSVRSTELPRNLVFGEAMVGGVFTYVNTAGSELRSLYYEIVHTGHEIDSFQGWFLDDKFVPVADVDVAGDGSVDTNTGGHGLDDVAAGPVLYLRGHLGTSSQAVDSMLDSAFTDIGANHRHRGCAKSVIRCDLIVGSESKWNGRPPSTIMPVIRGFKVYDPRADSTFPGGSGAQRLATPSTWVWSDNPALIWAHYRTLAKPLGPAWATSRINYQSVFDAANACDVAAAIPTSTTEKRFRCDLVVDTSMEPAEVVAQILATMAGSERQLKGQWYVYAGVWPTPDFALSENDLVGPIQYRKAPDTQSQDRYNQVKGDFFDRTRQWKISPFVSVNETSLRSSRDDGDTLTKHLRLEGVSREYQAQRLAIRALRQADDTGILIFSAGYSAANIRVGDTGTVSIAEFAWVNKSVRCVGVRAIDFLGYELKLKDDASGNYTDPVEGEYSVRTAAGDIVFGTVMPWYLFGPHADGWAADSAGKPAGIRGVGNVTDRAQLSLSNGKLKIASTPDTAVIFGFPAIPINDSKQYPLRIRHHSSASSSDGLYLIFYEKSSALAAGMTHLGGGSGMEAIAENGTSSVAVVADGPMPGTTTVEQTYTYTPTSGARFATFAMGNFNPATANVEYEVEWVALTELGSNVNVLPGVQPPTNTPDLNPGAATDMYSTSVASDNVEVADTSTDPVLVATLSVTSVPVDSTMVFTATGSCDHDSGDGNANFTAGAITDGTHNAASFFGGSPDGYFNIAIDNDATTPSVPMGVGFSYERAFAVSANTGKTFRFYAAAPGADSSVLENVVFKVEVIKR